MSSIEQIADDRTLSALQERAEGLVAAIRETVTTVALSEPADAAGLLTAVPVGVCVDLVAVWYVARSSGYTTDELIGRLGTEDRLVFEMVVGMYDTACHTPLPVLLESVSKIRAALS